MPEPKLPADFKKFDPADPDPCSGCSNCCEYVSLEIDKPTTLREFDNVLWYLLHRDVWVYIDDDNDWYIQFNTPCEKLAPSGLCNYYPHRPKLCRDYEPKDCVRYGEGPAEKFMFKNERDYFRYLARRRPAIFRKMKERINIPFTREELLETQGRK